MFPTDSRPCVSPALKRQAQSAGARRPETGAPSQAISVRDVGKAAQPASLPTIQVLVRRHASLLAAGARYCTPVDSKQSLASRILGPLLKLLAADGLRYDHKWAFFFVSWVR